MKLHSLLQSEQNSLADSRRCGSRCNGGGRARLSGAFCAAILLPSLGSGLGEHQGIVTDQSAHQFLLPRSEQKNGDRSRSKRAYR